MIQHSPAPDRGPAAAVPAEPADAGTDPPWQASIPADARDRASAVIAALGDLPALRASVHRVLSITSDPDASTHELVAALERDESLAANLLRYANSPAVGTAIPARTLRQAVMLVGWRRVRRLALEAATYEFLERTPGGGRLMRGQLHVHAVAVASLAAATAELAGVPGDAPHLAGLLHDLGKLVLPALESSREAADGRAAGGTGTERAHAERRRLGIDHAQVGGMLARGWGLPEDVAAAIAWHHGGTREMPGPGPSAACVQLANGLVGMLGGQDVDGGLMSGALDELGLPPGSVESLAERAASLATTITPESIADRVSELEHLARTDDLTGIANRRAWLHDTRLALASGVHGAVLMCDLDDFKLVNDRAGHAAGDLVLTEFAGIASRAGRAGRLGGDEFCVWVTGGLDEARRAADAITADTRAFLLESGLGCPSCGVSIGIAASDGGTGLEELLRRADGALYAGKAGGGGPATGCG